MKQPVSDAMVFECDLPEPRHKVWRALTEPELLAAWLLPNDLRPEVGARFRLRSATECKVVEAEVDAKFQLEPATECEALEADVGAKLQLGPATECEVLEVEPGRTLRWRQREPVDAVAPLPVDAAAPRRWVESVVSFELADLPDGGTHLRVVHGDFRACTATILSFPTRAQAIAPLRATRTPVSALRRAA